MNRVNYQKELDRITDGLGDTRPSLLLHACCAPCSSYCLEYLREYFDITVYYYNPNIASKEEYDKRLNEERRLIEALNEQVNIYADLKKTGQQATYMNAEVHYDEVTDSVIFPGNMSAGKRTGLISLIPGEYNPELFCEKVRGYENCPEGGDRCGICFRMRLGSSYDVATDIEAEFVTTTLTISPLKNADRINEIGMLLEKETSPVKWLPSDFKKKEGYKRSIELSSLFGLYRQNYCGCSFSREVK